jgi:hypothetical protein
VSLCGQEEVELTPATAANAASMLRGAVPTEYGSIEGRIETLSVHGNEAFCVWDEVTGQRVECIIPPLHGELLSQAHAAFGERVTVTGTIRYASPGRPCTMRVDSLAVRPSRDRLPRALDLPPVDITGGVDAGEYVRTLRHGVTE